jgi:LPXTG-motif cell wall-anchored protein
VKLKILSQVKYLRKNRSKTISLLVIVFFLLILFWYINNNLSSFQEIRIENPIYLAPALISIILSIYCQGAILDTVIAPYNIKLTTKESFGLSSITRFGNYISIGYLGTAIRAAFLKRQYNIPVAVFSAGFMLTNVLFLIISGIIGLSMLVLKTSTANNNLFAIIGVVLMMLIVALILPFRRASILIPKNRYTKQIIVAIDEYSSLRKNQKIIPRLVLWIMLLLFFSAVGLVSLYKIVGANESLSSLIFISLLSGWSMIFSITPANIGVNESLLVLGAGIVGVSLPYTITVGVLRQILVFITVSILAMYFAPKLLGTSLFKIRNVEKNS